MKRISVVFLLTIAALFSVAMSFQKPKTISLVQTPGKFEKTELKLKAGKPYIFEVENDGIDHEVGFVIAPKGKTDQQYHIQEAYVKKAIPNGETALSGTVTLEKGEYVYFCPLNPTPLYTLVVE